MKVFVYFNLHKKLFSVRALEGNMKGRVIAHVNEVHLSDAVFKVSEAGRQRVIREQRKNVHAGVVGKLVPSFCGTGTQVTYNPYLYSTFVIKSTGDAVLKAGAARLTCKGRASIEMFDSNVPTVDLGI